MTPRPPLWLKVASWSGLLMTLLYVALSIFPIVQVASVTTFALKISLGDPRGERDRHRSVRLGPPACVGYRGHGGVVLRQGLEQQLLNAEDAEAQRRRGQPPGQALSRNEPGCFVKPLRVPRRGDGPPRYE